jgi:hypothetical protein
MPNLAITIIIKFVLLSHKPICYKHGSSARGVQQITFWHKKGKYLTIYQGNSYFFRLKIISLIKLHLFFYIIAY